MSDKSQRTEKPTQRRLQKAREDGQFAVSRELIGSLQFVVFLALLISYSPAALRGLQEIFRRLVLTAFAHTLSVSDLWHTALTLSAHFGKTIAFAGLGIVASTLLFQLLQTRFGLSAKRLQPDWKRLNPAKKAQQLYTQNLPEFAKALVLLPMFCWLIYQIAASEIDVYLKLPLATLEQGLRTTGLSLRTLLWRAAGLFLVLGLVDFVRTQYKHRKDLRMSRQEIRDELKEVEGHPMIKARVRRLQRDMARKQMLREIPHATVVLTNPTHFAVAIRYEHGVMAAPRIVAKGLDHLALRIRAIAEKSGIPVVQNRALAQALYRGAGIGQEIPPELYRAVAEVLAFVYQRRRHS